MALTIQTRAESIPLRSLRTTHPDPDINRPHVLILNITPFVFDGGPSAEDVAASIKKQVEEQTGCEWAMTYTNPPQRPWERTPEALWANIQYPPDSFMPESKGTLEGEGARYKAWIFRRRAMKHENVSIEVPWQTTVQ